MLRGEFPDADYSTIYGLATGDTDNQTGNWADF
jgi:hypothetical protein